MLPRPHQLRRLHRETHDTWTLELIPVSGPALEFAPGQFNMLYLFGVGEVPISISGDPSAPQPLTHTVRAVGNVTRALCGLKPGALVGVRGPYGSAWPVDEARGSDILLVAGGLGLAPLRPAIYQVLRQRRAFGKVAILYGTRTPDDLLYKRELRRWRGRFDIEVEVTVDRAGSEPMDQVGVVTNLLQRVQYDADDAVAFVCGPEIMMHFTLRQLLEGGVSDDRIYLSMERNMKCAIGLCGHCQLGPLFVCKDGPVFPYSQLKPFFSVREL